MSKLLVDEIGGNAAAETTIASGKKVAGTASQFKMTGGSSGQYVQTDGSGVLSFATVAASGFDDVNAITATGTYTVPTGITKLLVIITGGGGGGAGGSNAVGPAGMAGAGGTTVMARVTVVAADTISVVIGAGGAGAGDSTSATIGGDSTFTHATGSGSGSMSTITAPAGKPGLYQGATAALAAGTVGANNEGISILGGYGAKGYPPSTGTGGATFWGGGGQGSQTLIQNAVAGTAYGSGGGNGGNATPWTSGAAGAAGVCFIMEFK